MSGWEGGSDTRALFHLSPAHSHPQKMTEKAVTSATAPQRHPPTPPLLSTHTHSALLVASRRVLSRARARARVPALRAGRRMGFCRWDGPERGNPTGVVEGPVGIFCGVPCDRLCHGCTQGLDGRRASTPLPASLGANGPVRRRTGHAASGPIGAQELVRARNFRASAFPLGMK